MDISTIFSMLNSNKSNNLNNIFNSNSPNLNNSQNIYPNCNIDFNKSEQNVKNNINSNSLFSSFLPMLISGQNINTSEIIKKIGGSNPMLSALLGSLENKPKSQNKKETSKIDVSRYIKVKWIIQAD